MTSIAAYLRGIPVRGYIYVPRDRPEQPVEAKAGGLLRVAGDKPPWIVVYKTLANVMAHPWPGSLWHVEVTAHTSADDLLRLKAFRLSPDAGYTRAAAVTVLEPVPVTALFGAHGAKVHAVMDAAGEITLERATALASARHPEAGKACTRVWHSWLARELPNFLQANREHRELRCVGPLIQNFWFRCRAQSSTARSMPAPLQASPVAHGLRLVSGEATRQGHGADGQRHLDR